MDRKAIVLRMVSDSDLSVFYCHQLDTTARDMAAFTAKDPTDRNAFNAHWSRIMSNPEILIRTIEYDGINSGHVLSYPIEGREEVSYWIGQEYWGMGIATKALAIFLADVNQTRPIYARVAKDNQGSIRVLEKCGFRLQEETRGFANARNEEIPELLFVLSK